MLTVFRVDSSEEIGFGHLSRCIDLAEELRTPGNVVTFVRRDPDGVGISSLEEKLFRTILLPRSTYLTSQSVDAAESIFSFTGWHPDCLSLDSYTLGLEWETAVRPFVGRIA